MKNKWFILLLAMICSLSACGGGGNAQSDGSAKEPDVSQTAPAADADGSQTLPAQDADETDPGEGRYEYPSEDAGPVVQESTLGYSMSYDPTVFTLDDTGEGDVFIYNTAETLDAPVYLSVLAYPDMDAQTLAEGLVLQSGLDGVEVQDTYFGAEGMEAKNVYLEEDVDGVTQVHVFYAVPDGEGSLLIEIGSYTGVPAQIEAKFEEMLGTFTFS